MDNSDYPTWLYYKDNRQDCIMPNGNLLTMEWKNILNVPPPYGDFEEAKSICKALKYPAFAFNGKVYTDSGRETNGAVVNGKLDWRVLPRL